MKDRTYTMTITGDRTMFKSNRARLVYASVLDKDLSGVLDRGSKSRALIAKAIKLIRECSREDARYFRDLVVADAVFCKMFKS